MLELKKISVSHKSIQSKDSKKSNKSIKMKSVKGSKEQKFSSNEFENHEAQVKPEEQMQVKFNSNDFEK